MDQPFVVPRCARIIVHVANIVETLHVDFALVIIDQIIKFQRIKVIFFGPLPSKLISCDFLEIMTCRRTILPSC